MSALIMTPALGLAGSSFTGKSNNAKQQRVKAKVNKAITCSSGGKSVNRAKKFGNVWNDGTSSKMKKKGWMDSTNRKGKGYGVYRFADKYGSNVDGYSPIYAPGEWSKKGDSYKGGPKGLLIWAGLLSVGLGFAGYLIYSTSAL